VQLDLEGYIYSYPWQNAHSQGHLTYYFFLGDVNLHVYPVKGHSCLREMNNSQTQLIRLSLLDGDKHIANAIST
jgi:hypothetical protein